MKNLILILIAVSLISCNVQYKRKYKQAELNSIRIDTILAKVNKGEITFNAAKAIIENENLNN